VPSRAATRHYVRQPSALSTSVAGSCRSSPALSLRRVDSPQTAVRCLSLDLRRGSRPLSLRLVRRRRRRDWGRGPDRSVVDSGSSLRQRASEAISKITIRVRFANSHAMPIITQSQACDHLSRRQLTWKHQITDFSTMQYAARLTINILRVTKNIQRLTNSM